MKRTKLSFVIDERQDLLDEHVVRSIYCVVEIPEELEITEVSDSIRAYSEEQNMDIGSLDKLHFTSMNQKQRLSYIKFIGKQNITAKIYVYYDFRENLSDIKKARLIETVKATQYKHRNKELFFYVERAEEYKGIIKKEALITDHYLSLLPDAYCFVFATRLNRLNNTEINNRINDLMYKFLRHQIRLHTYTFESVKVEDSRANRL
jgi:hypothetical protein